MATPSTNFDEVTGVVYIYNQSITALNSKTLMDSGTSYNSISLSLNVILTLMVITRLIWHSRNIRKAIGASDTVVGSYTTIVTMLVESYALYAVVFLLYMATFAAQNSADFVFGGFLGSAQVRPIFSIPQCAVTVEHRHLIVVMDRL